MPTLPYGSNQRGPSIYSAQYPVFPPLHLPCIELYAPQLHPSFAPLERVRRNADPSLFPCAFSWRIRLSAFPSWNLDRVRTKRARRKSPRVCGLRIVTLNRIQRLSDVSTLVSGSLRSMNSRARSILDWRRSAWRWPRPFRDSGSIGGYFERRILRANPGKVYAIWHWRGWIFPGEEFSPRLRTLVTATLDLF